MATNGDGGNVFVIIFSLDSWRDHEAQGPETKYLNVGTLPPLEEPVVWGTQQPELVQAIEKAGICFT